MYWPPGLIDLDALPEHLHPWYAYNQDRPERETRQDILREVVDVLARIIATKLTQRQQDVLLLYYAEGLTETQIATLLKISQPTVSQHLTGKKRGEKKVGGALRKLRNSIRRTSMSDGLSRRDFRIVQVLSGLLEESLTRRRAAALFRSLRAAP